MTLKGKTPEEVKSRKPIFMISGVSGGGKSSLALSFPKPYHIDTEGGANRDQFIKLLKKNGGAYFGKEEGSQDFNAIIEEIKSLITTKHTYKTCNIDTFSWVYLLEASTAEARFGNDFGKDKKEANKPSRQLIRWLEKLDMTVILICHSKDKWIRQGGNLVSAGTTFDGYDKLEYMLDLWLEVYKKPTKANNFTDGQLIVKKSRIESLPVDMIIPMEYAKFAELYGKDIIEKESIPVLLASDEQINEINKLLDIIKLPEGEIDKWFKKFDVHSWEEMTGEQIERCVTFINKKLKGEKA